jgi:two-component system LytT family response regulator
MSCELRVSFGDHIARPWRELASNNNPQLATRNSQPATRNLNMLRILIADDESPARGKIRRYLAEELDVEVAAEATRGREAVELILSARPDLVFLDVQMPDLDGFGVVDALADEPLPYIVFVTAHDQYAVRAFEVHAFDYLLKPVSPDRFRKTLDRVRKRIASERAGDLNARVSLLLEQIHQKPQYAERILVPAGERAFFLDVDRIDRVEAARNYVVLHSGGQSYTLRGTIEGLYRKLDPAKFIRANRSEIVRVGSIREVQPWFHGEYRLVLSGGAQVMWTRRYIDRSSEALLRGIQ